VSARATAGLARCARSFLARFWRWKRLLLGGTVVTETVFARPGLGRLLVSSILIGDFPVVQGLVLLAAAIYTLTHVAADTLSLIVDPRLRAPT
jgi:ABC-type dipeptide/oligopeptide/nickel transport system permease component